MNTAVKKDPNRTRLLRHYHSLYSAFSSFRSQPGGEIIIRSGEETGRIFLRGGSIAWVTSSTVKETFSQHLVNHAGMKKEDLSAVYRECKTHNKNFGETLIEWGLLDRWSLRSYLLEHIAECFLELLTWSDLETEFVYRDRQFQGTLLFGMEELLERAIGLDADSGLSSNENERLRTAGLGLSFDTPLDEAEEIETHTDHNDLRSQSSIQVTSSISDALKKFDEVSAFIASGLFLESGVLLASHESGDSDIAKGSGSIQSFLEATQLLFHSMGLDDSTSIQLESVDSVVLINVVCSEEDKIPIMVGGTRLVVLAIIGSRANMGHIRMCMKEVIRSLGDHFAVA